MHKSKLSNLRNFWKSQQVRPSLAVSIKAGIGGLLAISTVAWLSHVTANPWLMAPFGATCVLLFSVPNSPLSQPVNVIGGHLISTIIGIGLHTFLPVEWWSLGLAVGLAITAMAIMRITHPPAGADPLVAMLDNQGWEYVGFPVAIGSLALVLIATVFHRLPPRVTYPAQKS